jgi:macrolide transport system ATP-binding/permease protein
MNDLRYAVRMLLKSRGFSTVALLTLALGIGANTALFSVVDQLLVRSLPVAEPGRLAVLAQGERGGRMEFDFSFPLFREYQRENRVFNQMAATMDEPVGFGTGGATERQRALLVTGNYFTMLGVDAALGRTFSPSEGVEMDDAPVVVLSHGLWQRAFGADPGVLGREVTVNNRPFTIIGVAPREFAGTTRGVAPDLYVPITMFGQLTGERPGGQNPLASPYYTRPWVMGRLKEGTSLAGAERDLESLAARAFAAGTPNVTTNLAVLSGAQGFNQELSDTRLPLRLLMSAAMLVLLIACANLANLQITRSAGRARDVAIRLALGAGRGRILRELLVESGLLALGGGALGLLVAAGVARGLDGFRPPNIQVDVTTGLEPRVLLFALVVSVATGLLFGLVPALRASRPRLAPELKEGGGDMEERVRRWGLRGSLVVLQIALSLVVLAGAGLCARSLQKLERVDSGREPSKVALMSFDLGLSGYTVARSQGFYDALLERVSTLPGAEGASLSRTTPLDGNRMGASIERAEGYENKNGEHPWGDLNMVSPGFFHTFRAALAAGRDFNASDSVKGVNTVIVNEAFARRYWPGQSVVGKQLYDGDWSEPAKRVWEVVGVVKDFATRELRSAPRPAMYRPLAQIPDKALTLAVRSGIEPAAMIAAVRGVVKSFDASVPIFDIRTLARQRDGSLALQRMAATLLGGFGLLAVLLAALGMHGMLAFLVSRRTREIGVRMALGAQISDVVGLVLRRGLGLAGVGLVLGLAGAFGATRVLRGFLYEVQPLDPLTFGLVTVGLAVVAFAACYLPARRAAKVDPMVALRNV